MFLSNGKCYTNDDFVGTCSFPRRRAGVRSATQGPSGASGRAVRAWTLVASEKTVVVVDGTVTVQSSAFFSLTGAGVTTVRVSGRLLTLSTSRVLSTASRGRRLRTRRTRRRASLSLGLGAGCRLQARPTRRAPSLSTTPMATVLVVVPRTDAQALSLGTSTNASSAARRSASARTGAGRSAGRSTTA